MNELNPNFPYIIVTEYGQKILSSGEILPYDPDGYLANLNNEISNLDPMIVMYVTESLQSFLRGLMFSSAVMLGVASERAMILLLETLTDAVIDPTKKKQLLRLQESYRIKKKFDRVKSELMAIKNKLPRKTYVLESNLDGVFNLIRMTRNDAGHPSGKIIERDYAFVNLRLFPHYCRTVYELVDFLKINKI